MGKLILTLFIFLYTVNLAQATACIVCHEQPVVPDVPNLGPKVVKVDLGPATVTNAKKYLKLRERTNNNDAPEIDKMVKYVGLNNVAQYKTTGTGYSWCAAFVLYNYYESCLLLDVDQPLPRTAGVANLWNKTRANPIRYRTIPASQVRLGLIKLEPGDVIIWKHGTAAFTLGHTGLNEKQLTFTKIFSIEGNTSGKGLSREGGGVFENERVLSATGSMQIVGFIRPIL
jgi:hypothetical protein